MILQVAKRIANIRLTTYMHVNLEDAREEVARIRIV